MSRQTSEASLLRPGGSAGRGLGHEEWEAAEAKRLASAPNELALELALSHRPPSHLLCQPPTLFPASAARLFSLPVLLRSNRHITLEKFKVHSIMTALYICCEMLPRLV